MTGSSAHFTSLKRYLNRLRRISLVLSCSMLWVITRLLMGTYWELLKVNLWCWLQTCWISRQTSKCLDQGVWKWWTNSSTNFLQYKIKLLQSSSSTPVITNTWVKLIRKHFCKVTSCRHLARSTTRTQPTKTNLCTKSYCCPFKHQA